MRYNNKKYLIQSRNLNNSLVFYRALFEKMPEELDEISMTFILPEFKLLIKEDHSPPKIDEYLIYQIEGAIELENVNNRMRRFRSIERMNNSCEVLGKAIGLVDPYGNKWVIGDPNDEVQFDKCYINFKF